MSTIVVTAKPETTIEGICQQKINHRISGAPVVAGDGWPVGMVARNDLSRGVAKTSGSGSQRQDVRDDILLLQSGETKGRHRQMQLGEKPLQISLIEIGLDRDLHKARQLTSN